MWWRKVSVTVTITFSWSNFQNNLKELGSNIGLGLGWLRAVAQGYSCSCSCNAIDLFSSFQNNLKCLVKFGWGLAGCARWRKVTVRSWVINLGWGLDGCARRRKVPITVQVKLSWVVIFKRI